MHFQVCSNSAYPQHSGERYRTNGPLVFVPVIIVVLEINPLFGFFQLSHCKPMEPCEQNISRTA